MSEVGQQVSDVHRLLVSGTDDELTQFHINVCFFVNSIERRGRTVLYTVYDDAFTLIMDVVREVGVVVEEIHGAGADESYELLHGDSALGWEALCEQADD